MTTPPDITTVDGLEKVLEVTRDAGREASALVLTGFRRHSPSSLGVEHKGVIDLVTKYDRESEVLLKRRLSEAFPSFAIVGEEGTDTSSSSSSSSGSQPTFYVDPIDGTTNFVHGHPFWCVSIGLVVDHVPILGVVIAPSLGLEHSGLVASASGERRVMRNSSPCSVSATTSLEQAMLATGFPYDRRTSPENNFDTFVSIKKKCQAVRRCGSAALDLCFVGDGTYDGYWEMKLSPWDIAAGIAIVRAAGGRVTDYDGGEDFMSSSKVVATNGLIHDALLDALRPAPA